MTRFSSKWILSHSTWYKFCRSRQQEVGGANSFLATLFTFALAVVAVLQFMVMRRQADIFHRQAEIADKQTEIAEKQYALANTADAVASVDRMRADDRYGEQLTLAKENAATAKQNADAAVLNAQAVMNAERPWVLIENMTLSVFVPLEDINPNATKHDLYTLSQFKNYGNTPAKIIGQDMEMQFGTDTGRPPDFAIFVKARPVTPYYIPPWENIPALAVGPTEPRGPFTKIEIVRIKKELLIPWVCGFVRYQDVFGRKFKFTFCYRCVWPDFSRQPIFLIAGPDEYNIHIEESPAAGRPITSPGAQVS